MAIINFIITLLLDFLIVAIFVKVILSFVIPMAGARPHPLLISINRVANQVTEPFLGPIRRVLPTFGMFDFSHMVALVVLWFLRQVLDSRL